MLELHHLDSYVELFANVFETNEWHEGAFTVKGAKAVIKCNVILYHVYFERQVCVMYLIKYYLFLQLYLFANDLPQI
jgi:hypothetical protein